jgi:hypothetical protein
MRNSQGSKSVVLRIKFRACGLFPAQGQTTVKGRFPDLQIIASPRLPQNDEWHCEAILLAYSCGYSFGLTIMAHQIPFYLLAKHQRQA